MSRPYCCPFCASPSWESAWDNTTPPGCWDDINVHLLWFSALPSTHHYDCMETIVRDVMKRLASLCSRPVFSCIMFCPFPADSVINPACPHSIGTKLEAGSALLTYHCATAASEIGWETQIYCGVTANNPFVDPTVVTKLEYPEGFVWSVQSSVLQIMHQQQRGEGRGQQRAQCSWQCSRGSKWSHHTLTYWYQELSAVYTEQKLSANLLCALISSSMFTRPFWKEKEKRPSIQYVCD